MVEPPHRSVPVPPGVHLRPLDQLLLRELHLHPGQGNVQRVVHVPTHPVDRQHRGAVGEVLAGREGPPGRVAQGHVGGGLDPIAAVVLDGAGGGGGRRGGAGPVGGQGAEWGVVGEAFARFVKEAPGGAGQQGAVIRKFATSASPPFL